MIKPRKPLWKKAQEVIDKTLREGDCLFDLGYQIILSMITKSQKTPLFNAEINGVALSEPKNLLEKNLRTDFAMSKTYGF